MQILRYCAVCLIFVIFLIIIRALRGELALPLSLCISVGAAGVAIAAVSPALEYINTLTAGVGFGYMSVLIKALGISLITTTAAELCRDSGEGTIASKIELLGKCELIAIALPLVKELIALAEEVMNG